MKEDFSKNAVAYVRMSTDHQKYSTENQLDAIREYAQKHKLEVIDVYEDSGKSGLRIKGRDNFQRLLDVVQNGSANFKHIIVYDMSRWGRFQMIQESMHYEYICMQAGIKLHYCAEQFGEDGTPQSNLMKALQMTSAGNYSANLSEKVFRGACKLISLGFKQGGPAGFGLQRVLIDASRNKKCVLSQGEYKSIQTDRVILEPTKNSYEIDIVKWIYSAFLNERKSERQIAEILNSKGVKTDLGRSWSASSVHQILTNEKYIGNIVYNKTSSSIKHNKKSVKNPPSQWIRYENAFEGIIDIETFLRVRKLIDERQRRYSDEELLEMLKSLYDSKGHVSGFMIDECEVMPCASVYSKRFGSLLRAYELIGYVPDHDYSFIEINKRIRNMHSDVIMDIEEMLRSHGTNIQLDPEFDGIRWLNGELKLSVVVCRCKKSNSGRSKWTVRFERKTNPDFTIVVRMNADNESILDYYIISRFDIDKLDLKLWENNGIFLDIFRHDEIEWFFERYMKRISLKEIA